VTQELIDETRLSAENQLLADLQKLAADGGNLEGRGDSYETPVSHSLVIIAINISSHLSRHRYLTVWLLLLSTLVVICPEMTCQTGQMSVHLCVHLSVRLCGVNVY